MSPVKWNIGVDCTENNHLAQPKNSKCGFPGGSDIRNPSANAGDVGLFPGLGSSPEGGNGKPPSILAWETTEEPDGLSSMGAQKN